MATSKFFCLSSTDLKVFMLSRDSARRTFHTSTGSFPLCSRPSPQSDLFRPKTLVGQKMMAGDRHRSRLHKTDRFHA